MWGVTERVKESHRSSETVISIVADDCAVGNTGAKGFSLDSPYRAPKHDVSRKNKPIDVAGL